MSDSEALPGAVVIRNTADCSSASLSVVSRRGVVDFVRGLSVTRIPGQPISVALMFTPGIMELYGIVDGGKYHGTVVRYAMTLEEHVLGDGKKAYSTVENITAADGTPLDDVVGLVVSANSADAKVRFKLLTTEEVVEQTRRQTAQEEDTAARS